MPAPTTTPPSPDQLVPLDRVYANLGFPSISAANHSRRRLQRFRDGEGRLHPCPDFAVLYPDDTPSKRAQRELDFANQHTLVVPAWGGIKWPGHKWVYSLRRSEQIRDQGVDGIGTDT